MIKITSKSIAQIYKTGERPKGKHAYRGRKPIAFSLYQGKYKGMELKTVILNKYKAYMIEVETNGRGYKVKRVW